MEAHITGGELMMTIIPRTRKAGDVLRDPRIMLQTPITDAHDPGAELKLWGRVRVVDDPARRDAVASHVEAVSGWRPHDSWLFLAISIEGVALMEWERGEMVLTRWDATAGLRAEERRKLDAAGGRYVPF